MTLSVLIVLGVLAFGVPRDKNAYLCEYNKKIELVKEVQQPRILFLGGSTLTFGIDSKRIMDSLHVNVVNLSLHAGMGSRYPLEDFLQYAKRDDIVIIQLPTVDFENGGNGRTETMLDLMLATNWRNFGQLNLKQIETIIQGIPFKCYMNAIRLLKSPIKGFDTLPSKEFYQYLASGFNEYGDEVSHWNLSAGKVDVPRITVDEHKTVDEDFMNWFTGIIHRYKEKGCQVHIMPEIGTDHSFQRYFPGIQAALEKNGLELMAAPDALIVDNCYMFNGPGHLNREGVNIITERIINLLKKKLTFHFQSIEELNNSRKQGD